MSNLKGISQKWKHAPEVHDANPQKERHRSDNFCGTGRFFPRPQLFDGAENSGEIEREYVCACKRDEEHLEPEDIIVNVLERIACEK